MPVPTVFHFLAQPLPLINDPVRFQEILANILSFYGVPIFYFIPKTCQKKNKKLCISTKIFLQKKGFVASFDGSHSAKENKNHMQMRAPESQT